MGGMGVVSGSIGMMESYPRATLKPNIPACFVVKRRRGGAPIDCRIAMRIKRRDAASNGQQKNGSLLAAQQDCQQSFLEVQAIFGFEEDFALWAFHDGLGNFQASIGGQAMQYDGVFWGLGQ